MKRLVLAPKARAGLFELDAYITERNPLAAERLVDRLIQSMKCHRPANVTASGPGGVIQQKSSKISNGQRGLPRRPSSSPALEDGASQGARSDERSSLALDWRWPLPQRTVRIVSMNSVSGSVPPVPTRSVGPVHDTPDAGAGGTLGTASF